MNLKKCVRLLSLLLAVSLLMAVPANATTEVESRASAFFASHAVFLYQTSSNSFQIWFDVDTVSTMDVLGASKIEVYRSSDNTNWTKVMTFNMSVYPSMTSTNTVSHVGYVSYTVVRDYYYKARVTLYASNSTGTAERIRYTDVLYL